MLQLLNHLVYWFCEANKILLGSADKVLTLNNALQYSALILVTAVVPLAITGAQEHKSRKQFMLRHHCIIDYSDDVVWQTFEKGFRV